MHKGVLTIPKKRSPRRGYIITGSRIHVGSHAFQMVPMRSRISNRKTVRYRKINGVYRPCYVYKFRGKEIVRVVEDHRVGRSIYQPGYLKYKHNQPTMHKKIDDHLIKGIRQIAKSKREQSIALDFEREMIQPQRMVIVEGSKTETIKIEDFEMFGHTHPERSEPIPSTGDLRSLKELSPEFIIAGKSGKIYIMYIDNSIKYASWKARMHNRGASHHPIEYERYERYLKENKYKGKLSLWDYNFEFTSTELGRDLFYEETGVRLIPYKNPTTIELKDDPTLEKRVPSIPEYYMRKWKKQ